MVGNQEQYAKHRKSLGLSGVTRRAVQKAFAAGRIKKNSDGKFDFKKCDRDWEANSDQRQRHTLPKNQVKEKVDPIPEAGSDDSTFLEAQRRHEWAKVQKAELELSVRNGELLEKDQVKEEWSKLLTAFKNKLLYLPGKLARKVAPVDDDRECSAIIGREIKEALSVLSEYKPDAT